MGNESKAIDIIRANIQGEIQQKAVPAWGNEEKPFVIYWYPITLAEKQKIQKHARGDDQQTTIYTFIFKAMDSAGNLLFTVADKVPLMTQVPSKEIEEVALLMLGVSNDVTLGK